MSYYIKCKYRAKQQRAYLLNCQKKFASLYAAFPSHMLRKSHPAMHFFPNYHFISLNFLDSEVRSLPSRFATSFWL